MLKPRKRKNRLQLTVLNDAFVVHAPGKKRELLTNTATNGLYSLGLMYQDARRAPYLARQALYVASQRHRFACVGVTGLRKMSDDEWGTHQMYLRMRGMHLGHLSGPILTSELRRLTSNPTPEIVEHLLRGPRESDFFFGLGPSVSKPNAALTAHIVKSRRPGMSTLFENGIGDSPRINPSMRKSDIELGMAMKLGPEATKKLLEERLTVAGPNGERYFISSESGSERVNDLLNAMIKAEEHTRFSVREVSPDAVTSSEVPPIDFHFPKNVPPIEIKGVHLKQSKVKLINPDLEGVDPYAEDLTEEQKKAIYEEAKANPLYFFKTLCRFPENGAVDVMKHYPFTLADISKLNDTVMMGTKYEFKQPDAALHQLAQKHEYRPQDLDTTTKHYFKTVPDENPEAFKGRGMTPCRPIFDPENDEYDRLDYLDALKPKDK
jgi:hypothetical protein